MSLIYNDALRTIWLPVIKWTVLLHVFFSSTRG